MASTPKGPQKAKLDYAIDRQIHDEFIKSCRGKGYEPKVVVEKMMKRFSETGQI